MLRHALLLGLLCASSACSLPSPEPAGAATGGASTPDASPDADALLVPVPPAAWPAAGALRVLPAPEPGAAGGRLLLDAGHGAPDNGGNTNLHGVREQEVTRQVADAIAPHLAAAGYAVTLTRPDATLVSYDDRMGMTRSADWLVSLHSDARAGTTALAIPGHPDWWETIGATGFSVLYSDEGEEPLVSARLALARAVATRMAEAGFLPYPGSDYVGLYAPDATPGVFVDRHAPNLRIRLLRRPTIPSVIVETHEAHDRAEAARWEEPATHEAFAAALTLALADVRVEKREEPAGHEAPGLQQNQP